MSYFPYLAILLCCARQFALVASNNSVDLPRLVLYFWCPLEYVDNLVTETILTDYFNELLPEGEEIVTDGTYQKFIRYCKNDEFMTQVYAGYTGHVVYSDNPSANASMTTEDIMLLDPDLEIMQEHFAQVCQVMPVFKKLAEGEYYKVNLVLSWL